MFYGGYDYQMGTERRVDMRREVGHNRLESRLAEARLANVTLSGEEASPRRGMAARSAAVVMALFR
jgi:hypothetical protein